MHFLRIPQHPRAEVACPPLRWRVVGKRVVVASTMTAIAASAGGLALFRWYASPERWLVIVSAVCLMSAAVCLMWLTHLLNATRTPVTFQIANGELVVTRPFLFTRRRRRLATADVRSVIVSATRRQADPRSPTGRLIIRRGRLRPPIRIRGRRPIAELDPVAQKLRAVLHV